MTSWIFMLMTRDLFWQNPLRTNDTWHWLLEFSRWSEPGWAGLRFPRHITITLQRVLQRIATFHSNALLDQDAFERGFAVQQMFENTSSSKCVVFRLHFSSLFFFLISVPRKEELHSHTSANKIKIKNSCYLKRFIYLGLVSLPVLSEPCWYSAVFVYYWLQWPSSQSHTHTPAHRHTRTMWSVTIISGLIFSSIQPATLDTARTHKHTQTDTLRAHTVIFAHILCSHA